MERNDTPLEDVTVSDFVLRDLWEQAAQIAAVVDHFHCATGHDDGLTAHDEGLSVGEWAGIVQTLCDRLTSTAHYVRLGCTCYEPDSGHDWSGCLLRRHQRA